MMMTAASALHWEVRRALRFRVLLTFWGLLLIAGSTLLPIFSHYYHRVDLSSPDDWRTSPLVHMSVTIINLGICLLGIGQGVGMSTRQYSLPITSRQLAAVRLFPGAIWCAVLYLILCMLFNTFFAAGWPYLGPALTYGVSYMVVYSTVYRFRGNENRAGLAVLLSMIAITFWILGHYPRPEPNKGPQPWIDVSLTELIILTAAGVLSWLGLVDAIECDRYGAGWGRRVWATAVAPLSSNVRRKPLRRFWSPFSALFWSEWRQDGWLIPSVICGLMGLTAIFNLGYLISVPDARRDGHDLDMMSLTFTFIPVCVAAPWLACLSTAVGKRALAHQLWPTSQSTLPVSDAALGWAVLARCLASVLLSITGVLLISGIWYAGTELILRLDPQTQLFGSMIRSGEFMRWNRVERCVYVANIVFIGWLSVGLSTAAILSGRRWMAALPLSSIVAAVGGMGLVVLLLEAFRPQDSRPYWEMAGSLTLGFLVTGTVVAYVLGTTCGIVGWRSWMAGAFAVLIAEGVGITMWILTLPPVAGSAVARGMLGTHWGLTGLMMVWFLAAAPPALIPIATYYNRHR